MLLLFWKPTVSHLVCARTRVFWLIDMSYDFVNEDPGSAPDCASVEFVPSLYERAHQIRIWYYRHRPQRFGEWTSGKVLVGLPNRLSHHCFL